MHFQLHKRDIRKSSLELKKQKNQQPKIYLFLPPEKNPLVNLMSRQRKCHSFFIKQQLSSKNPIQAPFAAVVIAVVSFFFNFRLYVHTNQANFDYSMFTECCL